MTKRTRDAQLRGSKHAKEAESLSLESFSEKITEALSTVTGSESEGTWNTAEAKVSIAIQQLGEDADLDLTCLQVLMGSLIPKLTTHNAKYFAGDLVQLLMITWVKTLHATLLVGEEADACAAMVHSYHSALCVLGIGDFGLVLEVLAEKPTAEDEAALRSAQVAMAAGLHDAEFDDDSEFSDDENEDDEDDEGMDDEEEYAPKPDRDDDTELNSDDDDDDESTDSERHYLDARAPSNMGFAGGEAENKESVLKSALQVGNVQIQVRLGDLTCEKVDAIVNAANSHLAHGAGLAGAIVSAGGREIQDESDAYILEHGPLEDARVAVTGAGRLPCQHVLHAVGPVWSTGKRGEPETLQKCVYNCLESADTLQVKSLALPAISSGIFGFPKDLCAKLMFSTVLEYLSSNKSTTLQEIRFTNFDNLTVTLFDKECQRLQAEQAAASKDIVATGDAAAAAVETSSEPAAAPTAAPSIS
eukprot:TRINITY_DN13939_c0_g1_i1.p1 TRINITY_DN13939_c0_g1~~TRINITY_DN13939_c0_g1_i1.p1  ORF type:complete len:489 (-),score=132.15 TRINITY_DN13939_c0_g1_i1:65-1486(-)